jgi:hypothetical protein
MRILPLCCTILAFACGCEDEPAPRAPSSSASRPPSAAADGGITRDVAVSMARRDAAAHFQGFGVTFTNVQPAGRFWVVELRGNGGGGLHYAISKDDGSIRERSMVQ